AAEGMGAMLDSREWKLRDLFRRGPFEPPFKEAINLLVVPFRWTMFLAVGHGNTVFEAEQPIDGDSVVERRPSFRQVGSTAANQKRARRHQRVQFHEVMASFDEGLVGSRACLALARQLAKWAGI